MDSRQPFYGIESLGLDGAAPPLHRMEDIAADNLRCVRALQQTGPYYLCGFCFGARVAYEMARQLEAAGEQVGLLMMLDPSPPFTDGEGRPRGPQVGYRRNPARYATARFLWNRIVLHTRTIASLSGAKRLGYLREKLAQLGDVLRQRDVFRGDRSELNQLSVQQANYHAGMNYIPGPYRGAAIIRFSRDRPIRGDRDYRLDWLQLLPQCEGPIYVPGHDSSSMIDLTNAPHLAVQVNDWLESAQAESR